MRSRNPSRRSRPPASGNLPAHGKQILAAAYEDAKARALEDGRVSEQTAKRSASAQAWCAVKRHYFKRGKRWIRRKVPLGSDEHPPGCRPLARKRRRNPARNPMLSRQKREALSRELGGGLHADATVDELMAYMRSLESRGRITYDDDLEQDPTTPKPDLEDLWDELWSNYGDDTLGNPRDFDPEVVEEEEAEDEDEEFDLSEMRYRDPIYEQFGQEYNPSRHYVLAREGKRGFQLEQGALEDTIFENEHWDKPAIRARVSKLGIGKSITVKGEKLTRVKAPIRDLHNPYMGDAVELAKQRKYEEERRRWEKEGRRGPPPAPPRARERNPREATLARRIAGRS